MKIAGTWSGHDCSFCILENGIPTIHAEYERYNREKSPPGDAVSFLFDRVPSNSSDIVHFASVHPIKKTKQYLASFQKAEQIASSNGGKFHFFPHHRAHAANAFYSSNFEDSIVITIDGGGSEDEHGSETACTIWHATGCSMKQLKSFKPHEINIGGVWTRITRYVFKLQNGWPLGGEEGTIMAMAAFGDSQKYYKDFLKMLTTDIIPSSIKPHNQPPGATSDADPVHPYLEPWAAIARKSEQDKFDLAAGLQLATEDVIKNIIKHSLDISPVKSKNLCISGGVSLNSVAMGKIKSWFSKDIENIYIPPVPYDGGLSIGAAQIVWHEVLGNPRIKWNHNFTPYLGETWSKHHFDSVVKTFPVEVNPCTVEQLVDYLSDGRIVAVFNGQSESGRRALGNRSILADPRRPDMKDIINEKVKHRKWFRPFAPSILENDAKDWFENYQESPYMQFVLNFKSEKKDLVPAVVHQDGTARLQTVRKEDNEWYYNFLLKWKEKTGVPIILNTSFNDREPICEDASHSIRCFLGTRIDYLFFPEYSIVLTRKAT
jgi:carbamoyltransferase